MLMAVFFPRARMAARSEAYTRTLALACRLDQTRPWCPVHAGVLRRNGGPLASKRDRLGHHGGVLRVRAGRGLHAATLREDQHGLLSFRSLDPGMGCRTRVSV